MFWGCLNFILKVNWPTHFNYFHPTLYESVLILYAKIHIKVQVCPMEFSIKLRVKDTLWSFFWRITEEKNHNKKLPVLKVILDGIQLGGKKTALFS